MITNQELANLIRMGSGMVKESQANFISRKYKRACAIGMAAVAKAGGVEQAIVEIESREEDGRSYNWPGQVARYLDVPLSTVICISRLHCDGTSADEIADLLEKGELNAKR